jgi:hypothetical protein
MEDQIFDLEYQEWLREQQLKSRIEYDYEMRMIEEAYNIMSQQAFEEEQLFKSQLKTK